MRLDNNRYFLLASAQLFPFNSEELPTVQLTDESLLLAKEAWDKVQNGDLLTALSLYTEGINRFPEQAFFHACRSLLNTALNDQEGAFYDYQVAKGVDFNYHIYLEWQENKPDLPVLDPAVGFSDLPSILEAALEATQQFDYEHALSLYSAAVGTFPESADVLVYRGALHMRLLRYDLALADYEAALMLDSLHFQAQLSVAKFYEAIHEVSSAHAAFNKAATISPDSSVIYEERGNFLIEQQAYPEALVDMNTLVSLLPDDFYVYAIRADLLGKMGKWKDALMDYSKAIELNPYYSDLYIYRAEVKEQLADVEGAEADRRLAEQIEAED